MCFIRVVVDKCAVPGELVTETVKVVRGLATGILHDIAN